MIRINNILLNPKFISKIEIRYSNITGYSYHDTPYNAVIHIYEFNKEKPYSINIYNEVFVKINIQGHLNNVKKQAHEDRLLKKEEFHKKYKDPFVTKVRKVEEMILKHMEVQDVIDLTEYVK